MLVVLRGTLGLLFFDEQGKVIDKIVLAAGGKCLAANIPAGMYHTAVALTPECVVFEAKAGPYVPHLPEEVAPFAPAEGDLSAPATLARWKALFSVPST